MKVSIITPTADRSHFLQGLYSLLRAQTHTDWEWLIYDTSTRPQSFPDSRVRYTHSHEIVSIGEKRNRLVEAATGSIIVQCDDDDYYAPDYLELMAFKLKEAAFFNFSSWFSYDTKTAQVYYWATDEEHFSQYVISPLLGSRVREIEFGPHMENQREKVNQKGKKGYGFSYAYRKEVVNECAFPDCDFGEDWHFFERVKEAGFPFKFESDQEGKTIHVIHETNTSVEYPQYRIPRFLAEKVFPGFFEHAKRYYED